MYTDYLLVMPVEPMPVGALYPRHESLPLHCTLMPWFALGPALPLAQLDMELERITHEMSGATIELVSLHHEYFGPRSDVSVHVLAPNAPLTLLHRKLFELLHRADSLPKHREYIGENYHPHVSESNGNAFENGSRFTPSAFALIGRDETHRKVLRHFVLV